MKRVTARSGPQFHQLPIFMTPREIRQQYRALDGDREEVVDDWDAEVEERRPETDDELFDRKLDESLDAPANPRDEFSETLFESVKRDGVKNPVSLQFKDLAVLGKPQILGGHHRLAVAHEYRPDEFVPVEHFEDTQAAKNSLGRKY